MCDEGATQDDLTQYSVWCSDEEGEVLHQQFVRTELSETRGASSQSPGRGQLMLALLMCTNSGT